MKSGKLLLYVGIYVAAAYGGYMIYTNTKMYYIKQLAKMSKLVFNEKYKKFDKGFLKAWYKGAKLGAASFIYNGANYNTQGGTKIV
jgi:hypothetical protein